MHAWSSAPRERHGQRRGTRGGPRHTTKNRAEVQASGLCGCCDCLATFRPQAVTDWLDADAGLLAGEPDGVEIEASTACCPDCDMNAVLGSASGVPLTREFLRRMQANWFLDVAADSP